MSGLNLSHAGWHKSSRSQATNNDCVEVYFLDDAIAVRDSKHPTGPVLMFTPTEWQAFIEGAKDGEFDI